MIAAEPQLLGLEDARVSDEQVAGEELEILEVERRLALLAGLVLGCEEVEQLLEELLVAGCDQLERRLLDVLASLLEGRGPRAPGPERREVDQRVGKRGKIERGLGRGDVILGRARVLEQALCGTAQVAEAPVEVGRVVQLERQLASRRAERLVHAREHLAEALAPVRREQA